MDDFTCGHSQKLEQPGVILQVAKGNTVPNLATLRKLHTASSYRKNFHLVYNTLKMIIQCNVRMVFLENVEVASAT